MRPYHADTRVKVGLKTHVTPIAIVVERPPLPAGNTDLQLGRPGKNLTEHGFEIDRSATTRACPRTLNAE